MTKPFSAQVKEWQAKLNAQANTMHNPPDQTRNQFPENATGPSYRNDVASDDWRRGGGTNGAEGKPNFDTSQARLARVTPRKEMGWTDASEAGPQPSARLYGKKR